MSELIVSLPVIFFFLAVVAVIVWICKGFLKQRDEISAVRSDTSSSHDAHGQAA